MEKLKKLKNGRVLFYTPVEIKKTKPVNKKVYYEERTAEITAEYQTQMDAAAEQLRVRVDEEILRELSQEERAVGEDREEEDNERESI